MDDQNKNLILATVLSFLVILGWVTLFPPQQPESPQDQATTEQAASPATDATAPPAAANATGTAAAPELAAADSVAAEIAAAPRVQIDTPRLTGSISLLGGRLDDLSLKDYKVSLDANSPDVRLLSPVGGAVENAALPYYTVYGWQPAGGLAPDAVPGARTLWTLEEGMTLSPGKPVKLRWDNGNGLIFHRTIAVDENYMFTLLQSVDNQTGAAVRLAPYGMVVRHGIPEATRAYCSPARRTRQTAGLAGLRPVFDDRLKEVFLGGWEGHLRTDLEARYPEVFAGRSVFQTCLMSDGETEADLRVRLGAFLDDLAGPAVVVSHGIALTFLRGIVLGASLDEMDAMGREQGVVVELRDGREVTHR